MIVENANDIFGKIRKEDFLQLLNVATKYESLPVEDLYKEYITGSKNLVPVYAKWEKSVRDGKPDYSVYGDNAYMNEAFICWKEYSRRYLLLLRKYLDSPNCEIDKDVNSVLDLGCGCGYSTVGLSSLFPNAIVYATNLQGTLQYSIDEDVTENIENCHIVDESKTFTLDVDFDMIFASEFFEHLTEPIDFLLNLITAYHPKYFVFANTFTKMSLGHFDSYTYLGQRYSGAEISRMFNSTLRKCGYVRVNTGFFNNRPQIFKYVGTTERARLFEV